MIVHPRWLKKMRAPKAPTPCQCVDLRHALLLGQDSPQQTQVSLKPIATVPDIMKSIANPLSWAVFDSVQSIFSSHKTGRAA